MIFAICKDRPDDPDGFVYTVYFVNDSAGEISSSGYQTLGLATMDDEFVQTNTFKKDLGKVPPYSAIVIEQDDEYSFEHVIDFIFNVNTAAFDRDMSFYIPKYMLGLQEIEQVPVLNKPGRMIDEGT